MACRSCSLSSAVTCSTGSTPSSKAPAGAVTTTFSASAPSPRAAVYSASAGAALSGVAGAGVAAGAVAAGVFSAGAGAFGSRAGASAAWPFSAAAAVSGVAMSATDIVLAGIVSAATVPKTTSTASTASAVHHFLLCRWELAQAAGPFGVPFVLMRFTNLSAIAFRSPTAARHGIRSCQLAAPQRRSQRMWSGNPPMWTGGRPLQRFCRPAPGRAG